MQTIIFKKWVCKLKLAKYENGRTAIQLIDKFDGDVVAVATVNLPDVDLPDGFTLIKDYSENEGMLKTLMNAKVVGEPVAMIQSGYVYIPVCKLLV